MWTRREPEEFAAGVRSWRAHFQVREGEAFGAVVGEITLSVSSSWHRGTSGGTYIWLDRQTSGYLVDNKFYSVIYYVIYSLIVYVREPCPTEPSPFPCFSLWSLWKVNENTVYCGVRQKEVLAGWEGGKNHGCGLHESIVVDAYLR